MSATKYTILYRYLNDSTDTMVTNEGKYKETFEMVSKDHKKNVSKNFFTGGEKYESTDEYLETLKEEANDELNNLVAESVSKDNIKYRLAYEYIGTKKILGKKYVPIKIGKKINPDNIYMVNKYGNVIPENEYDYDKDFVMVADSAAPSGYSYALKPENNVRYTEVTNINVHDKIDSYCTTGPHGEKIITEAKLKRLFKESCLFTLDDSSSSGGLEDIYRYQSEIKYDHSQSSYYYGDGHVDPKGDIWSTGAAFVCYTTNGTYLYSALCAESVINNPIGKNVIFVGGDQDDNDHSKILNYLSRNYIDGAPLTSPYPGHDMQSTFTGILNKACTEYDALKHNWRIGIGMNSRSYYSECRITSIANQIEGYLGIPTGSYNYFETFNNSLASPYKLLSNATLTLVQLVNIDIPEHYESFAGNPYIIKDVYAPINSTSPWFIHSVKTSLKDAMAMAETLVKIFGIDNIKVIKNVPFEEKVGIR